MSVRGEICAFHALFSFIILYFPHLQPLFPQDRKGGVMVFPLRFIKKGTCQINVHTRHPVTDFSVKSNRRAYSDGGFAVASRAGGADAAAYRAERRAAIFCAADLTPANGRRHMPPRR